MSRPVSTFPQNPWRLIIKTRKEPSNGEAEIKFGIKKKMRLTQILFLGSEIIGALSFAGCLP